MGTESISGTNMLATIRDDIAVKPHHPMMVARRVMSATKRERHSSFEVADEYIRNGSATARTPRNVKYAWPVTETDRTAPTFRLATLSCPIPIHHQFPTGGRAAVFEPSVARTEIAAELAMR